MTRVRVPAGGRIAVVEAAAAVRRHRSGWVRISLSVNVTG
jgi:hypothetical protein